MNRTLSVLLCIVVVLLAVDGVAQCPSIWSGSPQPELGGYGTCSTIWDPDGAGPLGPQLAVGGESLGGGSEPAQNEVMSWDGSEWHALGAGPGTSAVRRVLALTSWNGWLVAGGNFTGGGTDHIALWTGTSWQALGTGLPHEVILLTAWSTDLIAVTKNGGAFAVQRWNGATWIAIPAPPTMTTPSAAINFQGQYCLAGQAGTQGVIERWNGSAWQTSIQAAASVDCLAVRVNLAVGGTDTLYAAGRFGAIGGVTAARIASTSGGTSFAWSPVGGGLSDRCLELHARRVGLSGTAVVAVVPGTPTQQVLQLSGGAFVPMGFANLSSLAFYGGSMHGTNSTSIDIACKRFDGTDWVAVRGPGVVGDVRALVPSGADLIVGGTFATISGVTMNHVARWDGAAFQPLGPGLEGSSVDALLQDVAGGIVAGGTFSLAGTTVLNNVARWDGAAWSPLGTGANQQVLALCRMPNGDVIAGGRFTAAGGAACSRIARWNGATWSPLGTGMNGDVRALAVRHDGTLFAAGSFTAAGSVPCNHVARWNGSAWSPVGAGMNGDVHGLGVRPGDDVVAVGAFTTADGVPASRCARWTGTAWLPMGAVSVDPAPVFALAVLPNGDVVVGHGFDAPNAVPHAGIARWNGSAWSGFGSGLALDPNVPAVVNALVQRVDGQLVVGGTFQSAGGLVAHNLAALAPTCPATSTSYGAGCSSAAGPLVLIADTLPWVGSTLRTTTTGVPANALCLGVIGFTPLAIPLDTLLPEGQPGCTLLTSLDITMVLTPGPGVAVSTFALANDPALVGAVFQQQTIPLEFDPSFTLTAVRSSNALALVVGRF